MCPNEPDKRKLTREDPDQIIIVCDSLKDEEIGRLVNLHPEGFMLIGIGDIKEGSLYQLLFQFADAIDNENQVVLGAECLWTRETGGGDHLWAGFHIIDISEKDRHIIERLIKWIAE